MGLIDIIAAIFSALSSYGAVGILAAAGWGMFAWNTWKGNKEKAIIQGLLDENNKLIAVKDAEVLAAKDRVAETLADLSEQRVMDLKESSEKLADLCDSTVRTLDKLITILNVSQHLD